MNTKRIIPCLDVKNGRTVKGIHFADVTDVGDVVEMAQAYEAQDADELTLLDISATVENRSTFVDVIKRVSSAVKLPLIVGGGIRSVEDAKNVLDAGAAKISVNSAAVSNPALIDALATAFGSEKLIVAIDVATNAALPFGWEVRTSGGTASTGKEALSWALEVQSRGAGEILLTSMDHDGTKKGFAVELLRSFTSALSIPIIASGGAGSMEDFAQVFVRGRVDAALAASLFHYGEVTIPQLKIFLAERGIPIRHRV
ncbi:MAG: imidazole glycerol phosphate synthase subunit HisF [Sphaerochaetaceae bacterium]